MSSAFQIRMVVSLLVAATIAGSWWYAAIRKPKVGIFYWLGAIHTVQVGITATYVYGSVAHSSAAFYEKIQAVQSLTGLCMAALYVVLVNWLVERD
jgi:hypothetical protein